MYSNKCLYYTSILKSYSLEGRLNASPAQQRDSGLYIDNTIVILRSMTTKTKAGELSTNVYSCEAWRRAAAPWASGSRARSASVAAGRC